jgi:hypothetical protein
MNHLSCIEITVTNTSNIQIIQVRCFHSVRSGDQFPIKQPRRQIGAKLDGAILT